MMYNAIESFWPRRGETKPKTNRPTVIPSQNPVSVIPDAKAEPWRMLLMKRTIQPPMATSIPPYRKRNVAQIQVTL